MPVRRMLYIYIYGENDAFGNFKDTYKKKIDIGRYVHGWKEWYV